MPKRRERLQHAGGSSSQAIPPLRRSSVAVAPAGVTLAD